METIIRSNIFANTISRVDYIFRPAAIDAAEASPSIDEQHLGTCRCLSSNNLVLDTHSGSHIRVVIVRNTHPNQRSSASAEVVHRGPNAATILGSPFLIAVRFACGLLKLKLAAKVGKPLGIVAAEGDDHDVRIHQGHLLVEAGAPIVKVWSGKPRRNLVVQRGLDVARGIHQLLEVRAKCAGVAVASDVQNCWRLGGHLTRLAIWRDRRRRRRDWGCLSGGGGRWCDIQRGLRYRVVGGFQRRRSGAAEHRRTNREHHIPTDNDGNAGNGATTPIDRCTMALFGWLIGVLAE